MEFFKPVIISIICSIFICWILIIIGAPAPSVMLGGFSVITLSLGKSVYTHFRRRINEKMSPFL